MGIPIRTRDDHDHDPTGVVPCDQKTARGAGTLDEMTRHHRVGPPSAMTAREMLTRRIVDHERALESLRVALQPEIDEFSALLDVLPARLDRVSPLADRALRMLITRGPSSPRIDG
jgi:hypothetical protein